MTSSVDSLRWRFAILEMQAVICELVGKFAFALPENDSVLKRVPYLVFIVTKCRVKQQGKKYRAREENAPWPWKSPFVHALCIRAVLPVRVGDCKQESRENGNKRELFEKERLEGTGDNWKKSVLEKDWDILQHPSSNLRELKYCGIVGNE
ncbi:hypothetical protein B0H14DRAFT_2593533 [Mycena olivaceomarginata]|nr:hypothetical protein B0H14DRAFT_2593533 [Mycena olivaceomarginata]